MTDQERGVIVGGLQVYCSENPGQTALNFPAVWSALMLRIEPAKCKMIRGCQCKTGNRIAPLYGTFFVESRQNNEKKINQNTEMFFNRGKGVLSWKNTIIWREIWIKKREIGLRRKGVEEDPGNCPPMTDVSAKFVIYTLKPIISNPICMKEGVGGDQMQIMPKKGIVSGKISDFHEVLPGVAWNSAWGNRPLWKRRNGGF